MKTASSSAPVLSSKEGTEHQARESSAMGELASKMQSQAPSECISNRAPHSANTAPGVLDQPFLPGSAVPEAGAPLPAGEVGEIAASRACTPFGTPVKREEVTAVQNSAQEEKGARSASAGEHPSDECHDEVKASLERILRTLEQQQPGSAKSSPLKRKREGDGKEALSPPPSRARLTFEAAPTSPIAAGAKSGLGSKEVENVNSVLAAAAMLGHLDEVFSSSPTLLACCFLACLLAWLSCSPLLSCFENQDIDTKENLC
jgi:hypothetical protein